MLILHPDKIDYMNALSKLFLLSSFLFLVGCNYSPQANLSNTFNDSIGNIYKKFLKNNDTVKVINELNHLNYKLNFEEKISDSMLHYFITLLSVSNRFDDLNLLLINPNNFIEDNTRKYLLIKNRIAKHKYYNELDSLNYIVENMIKEMDFNLKMNPKDTLLFKNKYMFYVEIYGLEKAIIKLEQENSDNNYFNKEFLDDFKISLINTFDTIRSKVDTIKNNQNYPQPSNYNE